MRNILNKIALAVTFALALALAISCSKDDDSNGPICSNVHSVGVQGAEVKFGECYDGSSAITEILCNGLAGEVGFKYEKSGKCPDGEKTHCNSSVPFPLAVLHEYGESIRCN
jgi:hypothetical protein